MTVQKINLTFGSRLPAKIGRCQLIKLMLTGYTAVKAAKQLYYSKEWAERQLSAIPKENNLFLTGWKS